MPVRLSSFLFPIIMTQALAVFVFSGVFYNFQFFVDSGTYMDGLDKGYSVLYYISLLHPFNIIIVFFFCLTSIKRILLESRSDYLAYFIFVNPYLWLLLANFTKESLIMVALLIWYKNQIRQTRYISHILRLCTIFAVIIIRPIYVIWFYFRVLGLSNIRTITAIGVLSLGILAWLTADEMEKAALIINEFMLNRSYVTHVGRDFFEGLCVREKSNLSELLACLIPVFMLVPLHEDTLSPQFVLFFLFHFANIWLIIRLMRHQNILIATAITLLICVTFFLIFLASPTFGAFIRYYMPVTWIIYFELRKIHQ